MPRVNAPQFWNDGVGDIGKFRVNLNRRKPKLVQKENLPDYIIKARQQEENDSMGKKRKPVRKPNYQSLDQIKEQSGIEAVPNDLRMAGDAILEEMREEVAEEVRQEKYLAKQLARYAEIDAKFEQAGVPYQEVEGLTESLRALANGVPEPYIDRSTKRGIERRIHTAVAENPYTGEREIIAFNNPETGEALVTEFGDGRTGRIDGLSVPSNPREVGDRASEILGKHIMWLQGDPNARMINATDFSVPDMMTGDGRGVDTHTLRSRRHDGVVEIQANTGVNPTISARGDSNAAVRQMIHSKLDEGYDIVDAIDELKAQTGGGLDPIRLRNGKDVSAGKLIKEGYDGLVSPVLNEREAINNVRGLPSNMQDKQVLKPEKIYSVDLHKVRDALRDMSPAQQKEMMTVSPNRGNNGRGMQRSRVNIDVPVSTPGVVDISNDGYVAQLLRELTYAQ